MRRRDLASLLFVGLPAPAQTVAQGPMDDLTAARQRVQAASAELAKFELTIATEPSFVFKAF